MVARSYILIIFSLTFMAKSYFFLLQICAENINLSKCIVSNRIDNAISFIQMQSRQENLHSISKLVNLNLPIIMIHLSKTLFNIRSFASAQKVAKLSM